MFGSPKQSLEQVKQGNYIIFIFLLLGLFFLSPLKAEEICKIKVNKIKGNVKYQPGGAGLWKELGSEEIVVPVGTTFHVGQDSCAKLYFIDGSILYVEENTYLKIKDYTRKKEKDCFYIRVLGKLFLKVKHKITGKPEYRIETPTTLAILRGTFCMVEVKENLITDVFSIEEGKVLSSTSKLDEKAKIYPDYSVRGEIQEVFKTNESVNKCIIAQDDESNTKNLSLEVCIDENTVLDPQIILDNFKTGLIIRVYGKKINENQIKAAIIFEELK